MPPPRLVDFSALSGFDPSATDTGLETGNVPTSISVPATLLVEVVAKNCCARLGARKPVEDAPRSATPGTITKRAATMPFRSEACSVGQERVCTCRYRGTW